MLTDLPTKTGLLHRALEALFCITINDNIPPHHDRLDPRLVATGQCTIARLGFLCIAQYSHAATKQGSAEFGCFKLCGL